MVRCSVKYSAVEYRLVQMRLLHSAGMWDKGETLHSAQYYAVHITNCTVQFPNCTVKCVHYYIVSKKSRLREALTLSTCADNSIVSKNKNKHLGPIPPCC